MKDRRLVGISVVLSYELDQTGRLGMGNLTARIPKHISHQALANPKIFWEEQISGRAVPMCWCFRSWSRRRKEAFSGFSDHICLITESLRSFFSLPQRRGNEQMVCDI